MGIINTAEQRLKELNGGRFQELATRYVGCKYGIASVHHTGRSFGTEETTIGTPDCFLMKPNGHLLFVECGKRSNKRDTMAKLRDDVDHCLDYETKHPEAGIIDEIVCCYGFPRLSSANLLSIRRMDARVALIGPEEIAQASVTKYPWLAREYLDLPVGCGALLDVQAFVERIHNDKFAADLGGELIGRDEEFDEICDASRRNQAVLLSGPSGCGKTRLAIEACERLAREHEAELYVLTPTRQDIYEDLAIFLSGVQSAYLLIDDANELAGLKTVVNFVLGRPNIRLVVTCRNYSKDSVERELKHIKGFEHVELDSLPTEVLARILGAEWGFDSTDSADRVAAIVKGNLRLAFLLSESSSAASGSIATMKELLEAVYRDKLDAVPESERKTISIASILGPHLIRGNERLEALLECFGLTREEYVSSCRALYDKELLDATSGFEAVSFEEQNLRDYFLYYSLVDAQLVQLADLWHMKDGRTLCIGSLNIVFEVFRDEETYQKIVEQLKQLLDAASDDDEALRIIDSFGVLLGEAGISRLFEIVDSMVSERKECISYSSFDFNESHPQGSFGRLELSALSPFLGSEDSWSMAVWLLFDLLKKVRLSDSDVSELFTRRLFIESVRIQSGVQMLNKVLHTLEDVDLSNDGSAETLFKILLAKGIFSDVLHYTQAVSVREVAYGSCSLHYSEDIIDLRDRCIQTLLREYGLNDKWDREIRRVLLGYRHNLEGDEHLSKRTYELISTNLYPKLGFSTFEELRDVHGFVKAAARASVDVRDSMFRELGAGKQFVMSVLAAEHFPEDTYLANLASDAAKLAPEDWEEIFETLKPRGQRYADAYALDGVIALVLKDATLEADLAELLVRGVAGSSIYLPGAIDACAERYQMKYGWESGRAHIVALAPSRMSLWLTRFDGHAIGAGYVPPIDQLVESLEIYGEVLPFETVCEMEGKAPGTLASYVRELTIRPDSVSDSHWGYLPCTIDELNNGMEGECDTTQNWSAIAELMCSLMVLPHQYPSAEVAGRIIRETPSCLPRYLASVIKAKTYETPEVPWVDIIEAVGFVSTMEAIGSLKKDDSTLEYTFHCACARLALDVANAVEDMGGGEEFDEWACSQIIGPKGILIDAIIDMATAFDKPRRTSFVIRLAKSGVETTVFERIAYSLPFNGWSWSGSELPLLRAELEYRNDIKKRLDEKGLYSYLSSALKAIKNAEDMINATRIREFVDPYLRSEE